MKSEKNTHTHTHARSHAPTHEKKADGKHDKTENSTRKHICVYTIPNIQHSYWIQTESYVSFSRIFFFENATVIKWCCNNYGKRRIVTPPTHQTAYALFLTAILFVECNITFIHIYNTHYFIYIYLSMSNAKSK